MNAVSPNYRQIDPLEAVIVAADHAEAWKDPFLPLAQWEIVRNELNLYRAGKPVAPFDALIRCLRQITFGPQVSILDVGASSAYYNEVLQLAGYDFEYTAMDFSPAFKDLAARIYPHIRFDIGDARALPYKTDSFNVVLSGCCLLHILDWDKVVSETARVTSGYAIFSKTPVRLSGKTLYFEKEAYGQTMLEIEFGEEELLTLFDKHGLAQVWHEDVSGDSELVYRTYLLRKKSLSEREWERA